MWMKRSKQHAHLLSFLPELSGEKSQRKKGEMQRVKAEVASLISTLAPAEPSLLTQPELCRYPWCFVMSVDGISADHYLTGALVFDDNTETPHGVCVLLRASEMVRLLTIEDSLPFWMMRSLSTLAQHDNPRHICEQIEADCRDLVASSLSSGWRSKLSNSAQLSHIHTRLSDMRCDADFELEGKRCVDVMPWRSWPECVSDSEFLWLWRQNRHGKIIESQRKAVVNPVT
ncbi:MAG TPA: hypothetical protein DEO73_01505 [Pantoea sp.]|nr:hypothetical protein [Pantoea sp.]